MCQLCVSTVPVQPFMGETPVNAPPFLFDKNARTALPGWLSTFRANQLTSNCLCKPPANVDCRLLLFQRSNPFSTLQNLQDLYDVLKC